MIILHKDFFFIYYRTPSRIVYIFIMFFCCGEGQPQEKSKYALEVFRTPQELSTVSEEKEVKLKAYIHANRSIKNSAYISNIPSKKGGTDLDGILNYFNANR